MQVSAFPDIRKFGALRERGAELKRDVATAYQELTTGRLGTAETVRNLNGRLGDAHLMRRELDLVDVKKSTIGLALGRASIAQNSLDQVVNSVGSLPEEMRAAVARGDDRSVRTASQTARASLDQVVLALNVRQGRRFLFSGDAVDRPAIASTSTIVDAVRAAVSGATTAADVSTALDTFFGSGGGFETTVFTGGSGSSSPVELSEGDRVAIEPKADEKAFRELIRGLAVASIADEFTLSADDRKATLDGAAIAMVNGLEESAQLIAGVGLTENRLETTQSRLVAEQSVLTQAYNSMTGRDPFDAASRAQELEALLQTTYTVTARLAGLSFNNYIR